MAIAVKKLDSELTFGKYIGQTVHQVLHKDPSYIVWAHDTIEWFKVESAIYEEASDGADEQKRQYLIDNLDYIDYYDFCD